MSTHTRIRRKRGAAIAWAPTEDSHYELARLFRGATTPLYLTQPATLALQAHARMRSGSLPFGLLAGEVCFCPQAKLEYLLIDSVIRARIELTEYDPYTQLANELRSLIAEQAKHQKLPIGWYLGGLANDLTLDSEATTVHHELFPERWQVALVHGEMSDAERGAVLRFEKLWNRWYSIPFFEESSRAGRRNSGRRTALRWTNYRADAPTLPLDELEGSGREATAASRSWWGAQRFGGFLQPRRRAGDTTPASAPEPASERAPAVSAPAVSASVRRAVPSMPKPAAVLVAAAPPPPATAPATLAESLEVALEPKRTSEPQQVASTEQTVSESVDGVDASDAAESSDAFEAPPFGVPHVFIDGSLVPVPAAQDLTEQPETFASAIAARISSLFIGALAVAMLFVLYLIAS